MRAARKIGPFRGGVKIASNFPLLLGHFSEGISNKMALTHKDKLGVYEKRKNLSQNLGLFPTWRWMKIGELKNREKWGKNGPNPIQIQAENY